MSDTDQKHGGPAFPINLPGHGDNGNDGMTLRDWFAGQALAGDGAGLANTGDPASIARCVYGVADAMLEEREK